MCFIQGHQRHHRRRRSKTTEILQELNDEQIEMACFRMRARLVQHPAHREQRLDALGKRRDDGRIEFRTAASQTISAAPHKSG